MPAPIRKKQIVKDGAEFTIASLTFEQCKNILGAKLQGNLSEHAYDIMCLGLNNALPAGTPDIERWTEERIQRELDLVLIDFLFAEILAWSNIEITSSTSGETPAAPKQAATAAATLEMPEIKPIPAASTSTSSVTA